MARRFRRKTSRRWGAGFDRKQRRPLEWVSLAGTVENLWPATGLPEAFSPTQVGQGTPTSSQEDVVLFNTRTDGGIITLTRLIGDLHIHVIRPATDDFYVIGAGLQLVPFRTDSMSTPRMFFDGDDCESKEWLWRRTYPMVASWNDGEYEFQGISGWPSPHVDVKTQRRYDTSAYALVISFASIGKASAGDFNWGMNFRMLVRTGTGLQ